jgi:hypothetical protein
MATAREGEDTGLDGLVVATPDTFSCCDEVLEDACVPGTDGRGPLPQARTGAGAFSARTGFEWLSVPAPPEGCALDVASHGFGPAPQAFLGLAVAVGPGCADEVLGPGSISPRGHLPPLGMKGSAAAFKVEGPRAAVLRSPADRAAPSVVEEADAAG